MKNCKKVDTTLPFGVNKEYQWQTILRKFGSGRSRNPSPFGSSVGPSHGGSNPPLKDPENPRQVVDCSQKNSFELLS